MESAERAVTAAEEAGRREGRREGGGGALEGAPLTKQRKVMSFAGKAGPKSG